MTMVQGMSCQVELSGWIAQHAESFSFLFPGQPMLDEGRIESYCGLPLLDSAGRVLGHFAVMDDNEMPDPSRAIAVMRVFAARARAEIERVRAEQALRISEQRLARILDSAMDAIITFDSHGRIEFFSRAAEKIFRCPLAEAIGAPLDRFLTAGFRRALEDSLVAHKADGHGQALLWAPHGLSARGADGREFPVEAALLHVEAGGMQLHTLIVRDIEERRRAEAEMRKLSLQNEYLQDEINATYNFGEIVGECSAMAEVMEKVRLVSQTSATVLILGETGTGKELIARAVHSSGPRRDRPLIKVDCAALPSGLVESELFGHEKGAFTGATEKRIGRFELANEGTIFLDEIGEIPPEVQVKLLRVLQEREFDRIGGRGTVKVYIRFFPSPNRPLNPPLAH